MTIGVVLSEHSFLPLSSYSIQNWILRRETGRLLVRKRKREMKGADKKPKCEKKLGQKSLARCLLVMVALRAQIHLKEKGENLTAQSHFPSKWRIKDLLLKNRFIGCMTASFLCIGQWGA